MNTAVLAIALASILAIAPSVTMAAAQKTGGNPHYVGPAPECQLNGNTAECSGFSLAGLGANERITVTLEVEGTCEVTCTNPAGNIAPGQDTETSGTTTQTVTCDKNGRCNVGPTTATLDEPTTADLSKACPNRKWTPTVEECTATGATLTIQARGFSDTISA